MRRILLFTFIFIIRVRNVKVVRCYCLNLIFTYFKLRFLDMGQNLQHIRLINMTALNACLLEHYYICKIEQY